MFTISVSMKNSTYYCAGIVTGVLGCYLLKWLKNPIGALFQKITNCFKSIPKKNPDLLKTESINSAKAEGSPQSKQTLTRPLSPTTPKKTPNFSNNEPVISTNHQKIKDSIRSIRKKASNSSNEESIPSPKTKNSPNSEEILTKTPSPPSTLSGKTITIQWMEDCKMKCNLLALINEITARLAEKGVKTNVVKTSLNNDYIVKNPSVQTPFCTLFFRAYSLRIDKSELVTFLKKNDLNNPSTIVVSSQLAFQLNADPTTNLICTTDDVASEDVNAFRARHFHLLFFEDELVTSTSNQKKVTEIIDLIKNQFFATI